MAYPTTIAWKQTSPILGMSAPVSDSSVQGASNGSQPTRTITPLAGDTTQRFVLGTRVTLKDDTYGEILAIYLKGVASTAAGDVVVFDPKNATTTRASTADAAHETGPIAVALQPCVASQFGLYAVNGVVPVSTASAVINKGIALSATAGQATVISTGTSPLNGDVVGAVAKSAQDAPGTGFTDVLLMAPSAYVHS